MERGHPHPRGGLLKNCIARMWVSALPPLNFLEQTMSTLLLRESDGKTLVTGSYDGTLKWWNVALGQEVATLRGHSAVVQSLVWSPDGHSIFTASGEATVWIWHAPKFEKIALGESATAKNRPN